MNSRLLKSHKDKEKMEIQQKLFQGIKIDSESGHLFYAPHFQSLESSFQLIFIRHGETYGNCGQSTMHGKIDHDKVKSGIKNYDNRIFQGNVDTEVNQLTEQGKNQALEVATKLETELLEKNWKPDIIFYSPLTRAKETALPFIKRNHLEDRFVSLEGIREMSFGCWDNRRVSDMDAKDSCHLFYRQQHALIKKSGINGNGIYQIAENFYDVLLRAREVLLNLEKEFAGKKIIMFSHSMFGAACNILYGRGKQFENEKYIAFDGKSKNGESYIMPNATPVFLNFTMPTAPTLKVRL